MCAHKVLGPRLALLSVIALSATELVGQEAALIPPNTSINQAPAWNTVQKWSSEHFEGGGFPPFSFRLGDVRSQDVLRTWKRTTKIEKIDADTTSQVVRYTDPVTALEVWYEATFYQDFPAIDWTVRFRNGGSAGTPILSEVCAIDTSFGCSEADCMLHYAKGVQEGIDAEIDDFSPRSITLGAGNAAAMSPRFGRSSWGKSLPFFNLEFAVPQEGRQGVILGIGWSGQWLAKFRRIDGSVVMQAGMEGTHLKLHPGEEIRTPKILLLFWKENWVYGQNLLRRMILRHYHPQRDGQPLTMPLLASSAGLYHEAMEATDQNQREFADAMLSLGVEYLWLDVGWHVMNPSSHIGPVDKKRFPNGLRSLTTYLRPKGIGVLAWFAPEFQGGGSWIEHEHPELFLCLKDPEVRNFGHFKILNFGDDKARRLVTDHVSNLIKEEGLAIYREDGPIGANLESVPGKPYREKQPLQWWRDNDEPDRQGITEIRYVEGLYAYWDELLRRNPGLIIDHCGGGATRLDLEAMSRGVYLWRTDYNHPGFDPTAYQSHTFGVSSWVPSTATGSGYPEAYSFRSSIGNGVVLAWNPYQPRVQQKWPLAFEVPVPPPYQKKKVPRTIVTGAVKEGYMVDEPFPWETAQRLIREFKSIRRFFYADYYPLTPYSTAEDQWIAYQFHDDAQDEGIVVAFRRSKASLDRLKVRLWGLTSDEKYEVDFVDSEVKQLKRGSELAGGIDVTIATQPGSCLVRYRRKPST